MMEGEGLLERGRLSRLRGTWGTRNFLKTKSQNYLAAVSQESPLASQEIFETATTFGDLAQKN